jgi:hypothetical protein
VNLWDVGKLVLIVATPTLLGAAIIHAPRWWDSWSCYWDDHRARPPEPLGPPIEQLAADLRRLLRLHGSMTVSAAASMRAHRLWAVEAAIAVRAIEAARALGIAHREPERPGELSRDELTALLERLSGAGLVLPAKVGPFTSDGRL